MHPHRKAVSLGPLLQNETSNVGGDMLCSYFWRSLVQVTQVKADTKGWGVASLEAQDSALA